MDSSDICDSDFSDRSESESWNISGSYVCIDSIANEFYLIVNPSWPGEADLPPQGFLAVIFLGNFYFTKLVL